MLSWLMINNKRQNQKQHPLKRSQLKSEKTTVTSKLPASVKSTSVNVTISDCIYDKTSSATSLSLSIEKLNKPTQEFLQKPDVPTYQPSPLRLQSSKVAPITFSTSISANGNVIPYYDHDELIEHSPTTTAISYLTKEMEKNFEHYHNHHQLAESSSDTSTDLNRLKSSTSSKKIQDDHRLDRRDSSIDIASINSYEQQLHKITKSKTYTIRLSPSNSSLRRQNNEVLPQFESLFTRQPSPQPATYDSFIIRAINMVNSILIPKPTKQEDVSTSHWIAKKVREKFSSFVQDIKSLDPEKSFMDKRIVIIGVHGWFPMKLVRSMIGEPTGTSVKFCEQMAMAIKQYFKTEHQVTLPDHAITLVPLEGEGKVQDRVNLLYQRLVDNSRWLDAVSSADVIFWATHSQGTPVSVMLLKKLLERGHIHTFRQSICLLAMAGISQGPFPALKGSLIVKYFEADAARELFEFMDSNSPISIHYHQSLAYILKSNVKVVLTGSMQDQVVPLYSAVMSNLTHPNILRAIYIDGHFYSSGDFLIHLVVFALRLRNLGLSDHGLVTHLSEVLAGSIYVIEGGHSTIYEELNVYMTAVRYTFEVSPFGDYTRRNLMKPQEVATIEPFKAKQSSNSYYIPWAMRGICSDPSILAHEELKTELNSLLRLFEVWNPTSSKLKELKFKLDPLKSFTLQ